MTRRITIRLRPEDLQDNPALVEFVRRTLNASTPSDDEVDVTITSESADLSSTDPQTADLALRAANEQLATNKREAVAQASPHSKAPAAGAKTPIDTSEKDATRVLSKLARRRIGIIARLIEVGAALKALLPS